MLLLRTFGRLASTTSTTTITETTGKNSLILIKDSCLNKLKQIIGRPEEEYLRIHVETGGCSGFSYMFEINNNNQSAIDPKEDLVFDREQYRIVVNRDILPYMKGSSIEYNESLIKSSFQVSNPIAETKCSCGSSFSVDFNKLNNNNNKNK